MVPRWLPKERASLRGRMAQRTASRDRATAATSVRLWPASASRPVEWATRPATTWPTTSRAFTARRGDQAARPGHRPTLGPVRVIRSRPEPGRALTPTDLGGQLGLHQRQIVGMGDPDAPPAGRQHPEGRGGDAARSPSLQYPVDHLGQQDLGLLGGVARLVHGRGQHRRHLGVEPPQVHRHQGVAVELRGRPAVLGHEPAVADGADLAPLDHREQHPGSSTAQTPRVTGGVAHDGLAQPVADQGVGGPWASRCAASRRRPASP